MAGTGYSSPIIKDEPEDSYLSSQYGNNQPTYTMTAHQFRDGTAHGIDPSELSMPSGNFGHYNTGAQQNMSFIGDDELASLELDGIHSQFPGQNGFNTQENGNMQNFYQDMGQTGSTQNQMSNVYSSTPDGTPIQSSFHGSFNYPQVGPHSQHIHTSRASPIVRPSLGNTHGVESHYPSARPRPSLAHSMGRQTSDSRSPLSPKAPAINGLSLNSPDSDSIPTQPIHTNNFNQYRHQKTLSNQWDSTPGSLQSYVDIDSPISSPGQHPGHAQISEILKSGKHASLPAKVDTGHHPVPAYQTQEAKRRRRRESHNMVERRRRDNINERIQELSHLVPTHRLEDEKVRKHMQNSSPLSPTLTDTGRSPPPATSLLAGGGRRATGAGSISLGIPVEEKDKGPNKGDILNGAVSWTRDLMWALHRMIQQEAELRHVIENLGHRFPYEMTDEEQRMRSELMAAMALNDPSSFAYTRADGSGLRVPDHTTVNGDRLPSQGLSPGPQSGGSSSNSGAHGPPYWPHNGHDNQSLKEEDEEYGMDMN